MSMHGRIIDNFMVHCTCVCLCVCAYVYEQSFESVRKVVVAKVAKYGDMRMYNGSSV